MATTTLTAAVETPKGAIELPAVVEDRAPTPPAGPMHIQNASQIEGEFSSRDLRIPRLNLIAKTGKLSDKFPKSVGGFLYDQEVVVADGTTPLEMVVLRFQKFYMEKLDLDDDSEAMPRIFNRASEVRTNGGTLDYDAAARGEGALFKDAANITCLIKSPSKDHPLFPIDIEGNQYGLALWLVANSAYTTAGKTIFTYGQMALKGGFERRFIKATSEIKSNARGSWYIPKIVLGGPTTPALQAQVKALLGME